MKVTFVGTGSGRTSLNRYHSSLLFSFNNYNLLVDTGDGISRALLQANIKFNSINGILFTHLHPDHFSGLGALIVQMKMFNRNKPLEIFVYEKYVEDVKSFLLSSNLIPEKMEFEILFKPFSDNKEFSINFDLIILPRENSHLAELNKYTQRTVNKFYCASFLFNYHNKNLMYTADVGSIDDLELFKDFELNVLISEITHITISDLAQKLKAIGAPKTYLIHINEEDIPQVENFLRNRVEESLEMQLAQDLQIFEF